MSKTDNKLFVIDYLLWLSARCGNLQAGADIDLVLAVILPAIIALARCMWAYNLN